MGGVHREEHGVLQEVGRGRSEEHTSELRHANISYAVFCLKKKNTGVDISHRARRALPGVAELGIVGEYRCHLIAFLQQIFFFNDTATTEIYTLSLHDALPI